MRLRQPTRKEKVIAGSLAAGLAVTGVGYEVLSDAPVFNCSELVRTVEQPDNASRIAGALGVAVKGCFDSLNWNYRSTSDDGKNLGGRIPLRDSSSIIFSMDSKVAVGDDGFGEQATRVQVGTIGRDNTSGNTITFYDDPEELSDWDSAHIQHPKHGPEQFYSVSVDKLPGRPNDMNVKVRYYSQEPQNYADEAVVGCVLTQNFAEFKQMLGTDGGVATAPVAAPPTPGTNCSQN